MSPEEYRARKERVERYYDWYAWRVWDVRPALHAITFLSNVIVAERDGQTRPRATDEDIIEDCRYALLDYGATPLAPNCEWLESELSAWEAANWNRSMP